MGQIAKLNEGMPPPPGLKAELHKLLEPGLIEVVSCVLIFIAGLIYKFERTGHNETTPLIDTASEMKIRINIPVNIIKTLTVRTVNIQSHLPGRSPVSNILAGQGISGAMYLHNDALKLSTSFRLSKIYFSVWSLENNRHTFVRGFCLLRGYVLIRTKIIKEFVK